MINLVDIVEIMKPITSWAEVTNKGSFENYARYYFSNLWGVALTKSTANISGAAKKEFDLVTSDQTYIGDAKWYGNSGSGKNSTIAEYVWLLKETRAKRQFLVFGNDVSCARGFLKRYRALVAPVEFYFLDGRGHHTL